MNPPNRGLEARKLAEELRAGLTRAVPGPSDMPSTVILTVDTLEEVVEALEFLGVAYERMVFGEAT